jgi:hypothetical protein
MEIVAPVILDINQVVDTAWTEWSKRQVLLVSSHLQAVSASQKILVDDFRKHLSYVLSDSIQSLLNLEYIEDDSYFGVCAIFIFGNVSWNIHATFKNGDIYWQCGYQNVQIECFPESFQTQLLIELGKFKAANVEINNSD